MKSLLRIDAIRPMSFHHKISLYPLGQVSSGNHLVASFAAFVVAVFEQSRWDPLVGIYTDEQLPTAIQLVLWLQNQQSEARHQVIDYQSFLLDKLYMLLCSTKLDDKYIDMC